MAFWTQQGNKDPKRNFRFQIEFSNLNQTADAPENILWWAKKVTKPNFTVAQSKHVYLGHTFHFPGKVEWQEIQMTLVDPADTVNKLDALEHLNKLFAASGYVLPATSAVTKTVSKEAFTSAVGKVIITQIDGDGVAVEKWECRNVFFTSIKFSDLDYENDDISTIDLTLRYDYATCEIGSETFYDLATTNPV